MQGVDIGGYIKASAIVIAISVPLALWKVVDILIWLLGHVRVTFG